MPLEWKLLSSFCFLSCTWWFKLFSLLIKPWNVTIEIKATEYYFPYIWCFFILLYNWFYSVVLEWVKKISTISMTFQMKATEQHFCMMLPLLSLCEILKCDHWSESYRAVLSCGAVCYAVQGCSNFYVCGWNPKVWPFKSKLLSSTFLWCCLMCCTRWF